MRGAMAVSSGAFLVAFAVTAVAVDRPRERVRWMLGDQGRIHSAVRHHGSR